MFASSLCYVSISSFLISSLTALEDIQKLKVSLNIESYIFFPLCILRGKVTNAQTQFLLRAGRTRPVHTLGNNGVCFHLGHLFQPPMDVRFQKS